MPIISFTVSGGTSVSRTLTGWNPTPVAWSGAAATFAGLGRATTYFRQQLIPTGPLSAMPGQIQVQFLAHNTAAGEPFLQIDTVSLGSSSAPANPGNGRGTTVGSSTPISVALDPSAAGITLADLNAGNCYLWVSAATSTLDATITADASGTFIRNSVPGSWSVTAQPSGTGASRIDIGIAQAQTVCNSTTLHASVPGGLTGYTIVRSTIIAMATAGGSGSSNCTASDDQGHSYSDSGTVPRTAGNSSVTVDQSVTIAAGTGTQAGPTSQADATALSGAPLQNTRAGITLYEVPASGYPGVLTVDSFVVTAQLGGGGSTSGGSGAGGSGGAVLGDPIAGLGSQVQEDQEMTRYIDDVVPIWAQFVDSSGAATDATGSPAYRVYEMVTNTPILTGSLAKQDDANTVGFYSASITASAANGFEVDKTYCVRMAATVTAIDQAGISDKFVIRDRVGVAVWGYADPGDAAGRATTTGGLLSQLWRYCFNRNQQAGAAQTVYRDDSTTTMLSATFSATDTAANKGKSS